MNPRTNDTPGRFLDQVRTGLVDCDVTDTGVLVAVSGGPDSVALLRGLLTVRETARLRLCVGHVNHRLRERDSHADADWVRQLSQSHELSCDVRVVESIPGSTAGESVEESARRMRYQLLTAAAQESGCSVVAVAHTADDQAETILHHLVRGTGITGLQGMPRMRQLCEGVRLVRPLLDVSRSEIESWLKSIDQTARIDASNLDTTLTRNRIRRSLLPMLAEEFNPQICKVLNTLSIQASELAGYVGEHAAALAAQIGLVASPDSLRIDCAAFRDQPVVLVRETLRLIWQSHDWPRQRMGFKEWQRLADIALNGGTMSLPECIDARRRGSLLVLTRSHKSSSTARTSE